MNQPATQEDEAGDSLADRIARALAERIVAGALAPGAPVRQDHVAMEFRASHVPVREAFRKLEAQGLLVSRPRHGVRVAPLEPSSVLEITEMRAALECLALRFAIPRLDRRAFDAADAALADAEASDQITVWEAANRRFHLALTASCAMPRLLATIADLQRGSARFLFATWRELDWQPRSEDEHRVLLANLKQGRLAEAEACLHAHITQAGRALMQRLDTANVGATAGLA